MKDKLTDFDKEFGKIFAKEKEKEQEKPDWFTPKTAKTLLKQNPQSIEIN